MYILFLVGQLERSSEVVLQLQVLGDLRLSWVLQFDEVKESLSVRLHFQVVLLHVHVHVCTCNRRQTVL